MFVKPVPPSLWCFCAGCIRLVKSANGLKKTGRPKERQERTRNKKGKAGFAAPAPPVRRGGSEMVELLFSLHLFNLSALYMACYLLITPPSNPILHSSFLSSCPLFFETELLAYRCVPEGIIFRPPPVFLPSPLLCVSLPLLLRNRAHHDSPPSLVQTTPQGEAVGTWSRCRLDSMPCTLFPLGPARGKVSARAWPFSPSGNLATESHLASKNAYPCASSF